MGAYRLAEIAVNMIEAQIRSNIAAALAAVRVQRGDAKVTTEPPNEYFQYETAQVYRAPAVFTIIKGQDFRNQAQGANHINALNDMVIAVVVEDRVERLVTTKAFRYQAALTALLHEVSLTSGDGAVRLFSRVQNSEFAATISYLKDPQASDSVFRKEVSLRLQVEHIENFE